MPKSSSFTPKPCSTSTLLGFDVGVNDQVAVGVLDSCGGIDEQRQPRCEVELVVGTMIRDRIAIDQLHDDVGAAVGRRSPVQHLRDMRVTQTGEDPTLAGELLLGVCRQTGGADQLDGDLMVEQSVCPFGPVHDAHAAASKLTEDAVIADAFWRTVVVDNRKRLRRHCRQHPCSKLSGHQRLNAMDDQRIAGAMLSQPCIPFAGQYVEQLVVQP